MREFKIALKGLINERQVAKLVGLPCSCNCNTRMKIEKLPIACVGRIAPYNSKSLSVWIKAIDEKESDNE